MTTTLERVIDALTAKTGYQPRRNGAGYMARCPAHDDHTPSLSVTQKDDRILVNCFAGCEPEQVMDALGMTVVDLFRDPMHGRTRSHTKAPIVATYDYTDEDGNLLYQVVRRSPKDFRQRRPDGHGGWIDDIKGVRRVLYQLPLVLGAVKDGETVYVVEGEKDAIAITATGHIATCNPMGAKKWQPEYGDTLKGANVVVVADRDERGYAHANDVVADLAEKAATVRVVQPITGKDAYDHLRAGHSVEEFEPLPDPEIAFEVRKMRRKHKAQQIFDAELRGEMPAFDDGTLEEILAEPDDPPMRIDQVLPHSGRALIVAQRKAGKTTLELNLARILINGGEFLGRFATRQITGKVAILNYEMPKKLLAHWADDVGIPHDRLYIVNLRGRRNPFDSPEDLEELTTRIRDKHHAEILLVDPFGRAFNGRSQNDAGEVTAWLTRLDQFATNAGISEVVLIVHAGWNGERTRGSSALEDWADVILTMTVDQDNPGVRYLRGLGRDVEIAEDRLEFNEDARTLTLAGTGSRQVDKRRRQIDEAKAAILTIVADKPNCSGAEIARTLGGNKTIGIEARRELVVNGQLIEGSRKGKGGGKSYSVADEQQTL